MFSFKIDESKVIVDYRMINISEYYCAEILRIYYS